MSGVKEKEKENEKVFQMNKDDIIDLKFEKLFARCIVKRYEMARAIEKIFYEFLSEFNLDANIFKLDYLRLLDTCKYYFNDVITIHVLNPSITNTDRHKIAGYTAFWINKFNFIYIVDPNHTLANPNVIGYINQLFSFTVGAGRLNEYLNSKGKFDGVEYSDSFIKYYLEYSKSKNLTGEALSLVFYLLEELSLK